MKRLLLLVLIIYIPVVYLIDYVSLLFNEWEGLALVYLKLIFTLILADLIIRYIFENKNKNNR